MRTRGEARRERLRDARLYLLFTPELCGTRDPLVVLDSVLEHVDVVQVRPKPADRAPNPLGGDAPLVQTEARELLEWCRRVLALAAGRARRPLVIANDRVDVVRSLAEIVPDDDALDGVHLGQEDCPVAIARELLGPDSLIGLSTHTHAQVVEASELPVDYLGFGPIHATATKGYAHGLGPEAAWVAARATSLPLFPIGGIDRTNAGELAEVGRAAVSSAILGADDPARAARELRQLLAADD